MQKIMVIMCSVLMMSNVARACQGITFQGNSGTTYCLSRQSMNWYSAYAWCQAQNMALIDIAVLCNSVKGLCAELNLSDATKEYIVNNGGTLGDVWSNTSQAVERVYSVSLANGQGWDGYWQWNPTRPSKNYALCK
ncbi:MAG: hypothetical protein IKY98_02245 [Alphaproteobacteria bacterium]|nr:hypothetical protein [Alphaproteobacteria bacterium]